MTRMRRLLLTAGAGVIAAGLVAGPGGCAGYDTWPAVKGDTARNDPNVSPMDLVQICGLRWLIENQPPTGYTGPVAVSLPTPVRPEQYRRIVKEIGHNAVPLTAENESLPIYYVEQIRVRMDDGEIDLLKPLPELDKTPDGKPVYQRWTITMKGGIQGWRVTRWREWSRGLAETPEKHFYVEPPPPRKTAGAE